MTKTYSTKATAKRALKNALGKIDLDLNGVAWDIQEQDDGTFMNRLSFIEPETPDGLDTLHEIASIEIEPELDPEPTPDPESETETETETETEEQPKPKSGYIRERSNHGGVCGEVWAIADEMTAENPETRRKDIIEACRNAGIAYGTARTQYQKWLTAKKKAENS